MRDLTKRELKIRNLSEALQRSDGVIPDRLLPVGCNQTEGQFAERAAKRGFLIWRHGWPDFLVRSKGAMYAVEVKKGNDRISTAQRAMFSALEAAGIKVFVWDPANPDKLVPWRRRARKVKGRA